MNKYYILFFTLLILSCSEKKPSEKISKEKTVVNSTNNHPSIVILGTIQDAGSPQIACNKQCCTALFENPDHTRLVTSIGLIDNQNDKTYLFEATPDIGAQMKMLAKFKKQKEEENVDGIFLTHAHIGHYTGLMFLGKEAMDAKNTPVYVMPRMKDFLSNNGPWGQLITRNNIALKELTNEKSIAISKTIKVTPFIVPHRDEYSETVGYQIEGPNKSALFIPDIDKWEKWDKDIIDEIKKVDYAFFDATFYSGKEINNRDIGQIPHPFIIESLEKFKELSKQEKGKIVFIHFNHTNPVIDVNSMEAKHILKQGYNIGKINDMYEL